METTIINGLHRDHRVILGLYSDNGYLNGNCYLGFRGTQRSQNLKQAAKKNQLES